jgi:hypothetical protein
MSTLKVSTIAPLGTDATKTITIGDLTNGDVAAGIFTNVPAFEAHVGTNQTITTATQTKVQFDSESFDTDGCYDSTTNYRFTPTVSGKYFVYLDLGINGNSDSNLNDNHCLIYKNGSIEQRSHFNFRSNPVHYGTVSLSAVITFNGSTDYIEAYAEAADASGNPHVQANPYTRFGAYRLIGV